MIEAVLFDGDQTLWDFERVIRDALMATAAELRAARPGPFADRLRWQDLQVDRAFVVDAMPDVWSLAELRVHGFARTLARRRAAEGGDERADRALAAELGTSYFAHRDHDPALFPDTLPGLDALRADYRLGLLSNGSRLPETVGLASYFESVVFAQDHRVAKPDRGSSKWWSANSVSGPRSACSWATTRSTTWRVRTVRAGARCGSTRRRGAVPRRGPGARCRGRIVGGAARRVCRDSAEHRDADPLRCGPPIHVPYT